MSQRFPRKTIQQTRWREIWRRVQIYYVQLLYIPQHHSKQQKSGGQTVSRNILYTHSRAFVDQPKSPRIQPSASRLQPGDTTETGTTPQHLSANFSPPRTMSLSVSQDIFCDDKVCLENVLKQYAEFCKVNTLSPDQSLVGIRFYFDGQAANMDISYSNQANNDLVQQLASWVSAVQRQNPLSPSTQRDYHHRSYAIPPRHHYQPPQKRPQHLPTAHRPTQHTRHRNKRRTCFGCGGESCILYKRSGCPAYNVICQLCSKVHHTAIACRRNSCI